MRPLAYILFSWCCLLLAPASLQAQVLKWRSDSLLTWNDFKAKRKPKHFRRTTAATTASRVVCTFYKDTLGNTCARLTSCFICDKSWRRSRRPNPWVLRHEQTHFDITELYARKMRKAMAEYAATHDMQRDDTYPLSWIYQKKRSQLRRCQRRYDRQTNHSRRKQRQLRWNADIARQLDELNKYAE